jgi:hypothetical protein
LICRVAVWVFAGWTDVTITEALRRWVAVWVFTGWADITKLLISRVAIGIFAGGAYIPEVSSICRVAVGVFAGWAYIAEVSPISGVALLKCWVIFRRLF